jgi:tryptophan synthase alpha chain
VSARVEGLIDMLHGVTDKAVAVGFGVSGPQQAAQIVAWGAEGVIVGSALVRALGEAATPVRTRLPSCIHSEQNKSLAPRDALLW